MLNKKTIELSCGLNGAIYEVTFRYDQYNRYDVAGQLIQKDRIYPFSILKINRKGKTNNLLPRLDEKIKSKILSDIFYKVNNL